MKKLILRWLCLGLVFATCFIAARAYSGGMDMFMNMFLGPTPNTESCGTGYTLLTGSDANVIHDSTGSTICCPN